MIRFPRQITAAFFEYSYTGTVNDFKNTLENLLQRSKSIDSIPDFNIKLTSDNEFTVINNFFLGTFQFNPFETRTNIKGYYFKNNLNNTQVNLLVSPYSAFPMLFLLLPVFFIVMLFTEISGKENFAVTCLIIVSCMIATSAGLLYISAFSKKFLLNRFVKYMNLTQISRC